MNVFTKKTNKLINFLIADSNFIVGKDETLKPKFTRIFGEKYFVNVYYLKIQSPTLNLDKNNINISLPMSFRKLNNQELLNTILLKMYTKIAEQELELVFEKARHTFKFAPEDYDIRKINGMLANCDKDLQSICINPYIVMYEKEVIEYVVFHEFCHLKYKTHSKKFYDMLKKYLPNYENISKKISNLKY